MNNKKSKERETLKLIFQELQEDPYHKFNIAFALMSVIPLLVFLYLLAAVLFTLDILEGEIGFIVTMTLLMTLAGYYAGYIIIRNILKKVMFYAASAKHSEQLKALLVASVSHEIKNPIAALKSNLFNIISGFVGKVADEQKKILGLCYDITQRMARLTTGLLDLYAIEAGMVPLEIKETGLAGLLRKLLDEFEDRFKEKRIALVKKIPEKEIIARLDEDKITQVISNIVNNAIKYTPEEGTVTVKLAVEEGFARFECMDTGEGVPEDKLLDIFNKFVRTSRSKKGIGLGLAITKDLVELHKGTVFAESRPGEGSKFTVILPLDAGMAEKRTVKSEIGH